jgi:hypothetical protein
MAWLVHVIQMEGEGIHKRVLGCEPMCRRNRGKPTKSCIEDIEKDIQIMGIKR